MLDKEEQEILSFRDNIEINQNRMELLKKYIEILDTYQSKLNLIGKSTRKNIWTRHLLDSAQIINLLPKQNKKDLIIDIGTGAGFPGLVLSILGRKDIILCDKSNKKINFLNFVVKKCNLKVKIYNGKIEEYNNNNIKVIVSRAFSPLKNLLKSVNHILNPKTVIIIHKGRKHMQELEEAKKYYSFTVNTYNSITDSFGKILKIKNVEKTYDI